METVYDKLKEYQKNYPSLTFDNNGFEYLSMEVKESHKEQISEINNILKKEISGFIYFDNFKPRKNGTFSIRYQCHWSESFIVVGYTDIEDFK